MCQADGKRWIDYSILQSTQDYLAGVSSDTGMPVSTLVRSTKAGSTVVRVSGPGLLRWQLHYRDCQRGHGELTVLALRRGGGELRPDMGARQLRWYRCGFVGSTVNLHLTSSYLRERILDRCLPPQAPWTLPLFPWVRLSDGQGPSPERRPLQAGQRGLGLARVGHLDKAKAPRAAGRPALHDPDAVDGPIGVKEQ